MLSRLLEPGREELLDLATAPRRLEPPPDRLVLDDHERWDCLDVEAVEQVGMLLLRDVMQNERVVVLTPLQHLGDEAFDSAAAPRHRRMEEHQAWAPRTRPRVGLRLASDCCHRDVPAPRLSSGRSRTSGRAR